MYRSKFETFQVFCHRAALFCVIALAVAGCDPGAVSGKQSTSGGGSPSSGSSNQPPRITGQPPTTASVGVTYLFVPTASDPNGDSLRYEIARKPAWATFDPGTGQLYGTPTSGSTGVFSSIQISVTDGQASAALPAFSITVSASAGVGSATLHWAVPTQTISGAPLTDLAGFRVYYSQSSVALDRVLVVPDPTATQAVVGNLGPGTWFFAVTAYTQSGAESTPSGTVSKAF